MKIDKYFTFMILLFILYNIYRIVMKDFNEYLFESYLAESMLYLSPKLRSHIKSIDHNIAREIINLELTDIKPDMTLIDVDKNDNYLSFIPMANAQKTLDEFYPNSEDRFISVNADQETADYLWYNRDRDGIAPVYKKGRNLIKIGKFVNKVLNGKYSASEVEKFVNLFKASSPDKRGSFEVVSGKDIKYWYYRENYLYNGGTLGNSCMADKGEYFGIYIDNPDTCKLLILKEGDKLVARALVWKINTISSPDEKFRGKILGEYFLDRVYSVEDYQVEKLRKYADKKGWVIRKQNSSFDQGGVYYKGRIYNETKITVKVQPKEYKKYPYLDTFIRYDSRKGLLHNDKIRKKGGHILRSTWGEHTPSIPRRSVIINRFADFFRRG